MKSDRKTGQMAGADNKRREALKRIGRFAAVTPPAVSLLLAGASKPTKAAPISPTDTMDGTG